MTDSDTTYYTDEKVKSAIIVSMFKKKVTLDPSAGYTPKVNDLVSEKTAKHHLLTDAEGETPVGVIESYNSTKKEAVIADVSFSEADSLRYGVITATKANTANLRTYGIHIDKDLTQA